MDIRRRVRSVDAFQQRHVASAFPYAVFKKYGDDQGGNLAALIAYYAFLSLFPLLLVFFTALSFVLHSHPGLQNQLRTSALADFPIVGNQISRNVTSVRGSGIGLAIGIVGTFWGGLGVAGAAQNAMNQVWEVPMRARPGLLPRTARSLATVGMIGASVVVTTLLSGVGGGDAGIGLGLRAAAIVASLGLNFVMFLLAFTVLTANAAGWRDHIPGAVVAALAWEVLQALGGFYVSHVLRGMTQTYGLFAIVLGLLAWLALQAQIIVYAAEVNVVRVRRLWPRSLALPLTEADERALAEYARIEQRQIEPSGPTSG